jgi:tetratricopeptide (TPR) repeat protein
LALFGRKKTEETKGDGAGAQIAPAANGNGSNGGGGAKVATGGSDPGGDAPDPSRFSPGKAARFFEHAKTVHDTSNYTYAMQLWLNGMRHEPTSMTGLQGFAASALAFQDDPGSKKKAAIKEMEKAFGAGRDGIDRFLAALLQYGLSLQDAALSGRAAEQGAVLGLSGPAVWLADRCLAANISSPKPRKDLFVKCAKVYEKFGVFDKAAKAADAACKLDPSDGPLAAAARNLAAQATMTKGGFDTVGAEGSFRANVRDSEKQRHLDEAERIVKSEETIDRLLKTAEEEFQKRPEDVPTINNYAKRLRERGQPEDVTKALRILEDAYARTKQFSFRKDAGDIRLTLARRHVSDLKDAATARPTDTAANDKYRKALSDLMHLEIDEYQARVEAYPTDMGLKFELGRRYFHVGRYEDAIGLFQDTRHDPKHKAASLGCLADCFQKIDWLDEAIDTYRQAIEAHPIASDEVGMGLRYGLLTTLQTKAERERALDVAEEADKLASTIAMQQINYRDVRARRDVIKKLIAAIKTAAKGG